MVKLFIFLLWMVLNVDHNIIMIKCYPGWSISCLTQCHTPLKLQYNVCDSECLLLVLLQVLEFSKQEGQMENTQALLNGVFESCKLTPAFI